MTESTETGPARRRIGALALLVVGVLLVLTTFGRSIPKEQQLVFSLPRYPDAVATRLDAQFTPAGEWEPVRGVSLALGSPQPTEVRHPLRLPDGDYIVSLALTFNHSSGPSAPEKMETSRSHRVSLEGHETRIVFDAEGSD